MNIYLKILLIILSVAFVGPLISLITFLSQLLHMYFTPFLLGTEPPIPTEFLILFLQLLIISIIIQGISIFLIFLRYKNSKKIKIEIYKCSLISKVLFSFLLSLSSTNIFYTIISFPLILVFITILILVTIEHNVNILFSLFILICTILVYVLILFISIFLLNFSSQKLLEKENNFKISFKERFFLKMPNIFLLVFIIIDVMIFSILYIFIQLHFYFWTKYILGSFAILIFLFLIYREFSKFLINFCKK